MDWRKVSISKEQHGQNREPKVFSGPHSHHPHPSLRATEHSASWFVSAWDYPTAFPVQEALFKSQDQSYPDAPLGSLTFHDSQNNCKLWVNLVSNLHMTKECFLLSWCFLFLNTAPLPPRNAFQRYFKYPSLYLLNTCCQELCRTGSHNLPWLVALL